MSPQMSAYREIAPSVQSRRPTGGETYQLSTHQLTLKDTVMTLYGEDMATVIAQDDDDELVS